MITIETIGLSKRYQNRANRNGTWVLEDVSLKLETIGATAALGPNGVGKSTFLKTLIGAIAPTQGTVLVNGAAPTPGRIRYVPQNCPILPWRRVVDDMCLGLEIAGYGKKDRHKYAERLLDEIGLSLPLEQRSCTLSGGQRQLLNVCRALVGPDRPELILADELFSALDITSRMQFLAYFDVILKTYETPILFTAHDLELAVLASDWIIPFQSMPVIVGNDDLIKVDLPRPRTREMLLTPEFHKVHSLVTERLFASTSKRVS